MSADWRVRMLVARLSAFLVDVAVTAAIIGTAQAALLALGLNPVGGPIGQGQRHLWVAATATLPALLYFVATSWLHGATLGQRVTALRLLPLDGEGRVPMVRLVLRFALLLALFELVHTAMLHQALWAFIGVYVLAGALGLSMLLHPETRGLHDLLGGTRVVRRHGHAEAEEDD